LGWSQPRTSKAVKAWKEAGQITVGHADSNATACLSGHGHIEDNASRGMLLSMLSAMPVSMPKGMPKTMPETMPWPMPRAMPEAMPN
jgi:hypothetical protein